MKRMRWPKPPFLLKKFTRIFILKYRMVLDRPKCQKLETSFRKKNKQKKVQYNKIEAEIKSLYSKRRKIVQTS